MKWVRVEGMAEQPNCCVACGSNAVDQSGHQQTALFAEGVDIDWGNSLYLCWECVQIIADLGGRATKGGFDKLTEKYEKLLEEHRALKEEHEEQGMLVRQIREGVAARKKIQGRAA